MDGSRVKCKNCRYNKKYILKHLSKSTECNESYSKKEIVDLEELSKSNQDLNTIHSNGLKDIRLKNKKFQKSTKETNKLLSMKEEDKENYKPLEIMTNQ
jgi:hypothetical protein